MLHLKKLNFQTPEDDTEVVGIVWLNLFVRRRYVINVKATVTERS